MDEIRHGAVVWVEVEDPQGSNEKERPAIVIAKSSSSVLLLVCGTSRFDETNLSDDEICLAYGSNCKTGLIKATVAKCTWIAEMNDSDVIRKIGFVRSLCLVQILNRVKTMETQNRVVRV